MREVIIDEQTQKLIDYLEESRAIPILKVFVMDQPVTELLMNIKVKSKKYFLQF